MSNLCSTGHAFAKNHTFTTLSCLAVKSSAERRGRMISIDMSWPVSPGILEYSSDKVKGFTRDPLKVMGCAIRVEFATHYVLALEKVACEA
jgi:hypothetical protein